MSETTSVTDHGSPSTNAVKEKAPPNVYKGLEIRGSSDHEDVDLKYTRFEKARIIGARALQISMGAPVLIDIPDDLIDPIEIALTEFSREVIPITVKRGESG